MSELIRSRTGLVPIAALDTQLISNLSHPQHREAVEDLTGALRKEGYAVAVTGTVLSELAATKQRERWFAHFEKVKTHCDLVVPVERGDLVRLEIEGQDPRDLILTKLFDAKGLPDVSDARQDPELWEYSAEDKAWKGRLAEALSRNDNHHATLTTSDIPSFPEFLAAEKRNQAAELLKAWHAGGVFEAEVTEQLLDRLLETGLAFRAAVFLGIANQYDRMERATRKLRTKAGGSLSDMTVLSEAAYFDLVVTMDEDFGRAGALLKGYIPTPAIRYVRPTT